MGINSVLLFDQQQNQQQVQQGGRGGVSSLMKPEQNTSQTKGGSALGTISEDKVTISQLAKSTASNNFNQSNPPTYSYGQGGNSMRNYGGVNTGSGNFTTTPAGFSAGGPDSGVTPQFSERPGLSFGSKG